MTMADAIHSRLNNAVWSRGAFLGDYATRELRPVEVDVLLRYRDAFAGRVLELGCGAGRVTGYLTAIAREAHGLDLSPAMIEYSRSRYPRGVFAVGDLRDLSRYEPGSFDAVMAACNVLDILGDDERRQVLREIHRVLAEGGLLVMSSHNRGYIPRLRPPTRVRLGRLRTLVGDVVLMPRRVRNHLRLRRFQRFERDYAILNDSAHDYSLLQYYISPAQQARQLGAEGFELLECLDLEGGRIESPDGPPDLVELHYVARRAAGA